MSRYWEATGETKRKIDEWGQKRVSVQSEMFALAKRHGTKDIGISQGGLGTEFVLIFQEGPDDPTVWVPTKKAKNQYKPNPRTKVGRALAEEMKEICRRMPDGASLGNLIGYSLFVESRWRTPGIRNYRSRVFLITDSDWSPEGEVAADLARVPDTEFESLFPREDPEPG